MCKSHLSFHMLHIQKGFSQVTKEVIQLETGPKMPNS